MDLLEEATEVILDLAENHPEYTMDQFVADFKATFERNPTIAEKQLFLKSVKKVKSKLVGIAPKVISGYTFGEVLGKGSFGEVYKAEKGGFECAVKRIDESHLSGDVEQSFADSISARLNSKFLVRYFDKFRGPDGELYVVMELCQKGDLRNLIDQLKKMKAVLQTPRIAKILAQLLLALNVLHCNKLIHRDIKPENVFSDKEDNVKLGDLGCAKVFDTTSAKACTVIGTPLYESPQVLRGEEYDASADMWALGVLLYELCALERPFQHANRYKLQEIIIAGKYAPLPAGRYPSEVSEIIASLLSVNPKQRPSANALLQHPFIRTYVTTPDMCACIATVTGSTPSSTSAASVATKAPTPFAEASSSTTTSTGVTQPKLPEGPVGKELPVGWEARFDGKRKRYYYINRKKAITQWKKPQEPVEVDDLDEGVIRKKLPTGWEERYDKIKKRYYYINKKINKTQWIFPEGEENVDQ